MRCCRLCLYFFRLWRWLLLIRVFNRRLRSYQSLNPRICCLARKSRAGLSRLSMLGLWWWVQLDSFTHGRGTKCHLHTLLSCETAESFGWFRSFDLARLWPPITFLLRNIPATTSMLLILSQFDFTGSVLTNRLQVSVDYLHRGEPTSRMRPRLEGITW